MNDLDFLFDETTPDVYGTAELVDYFDYLDSIGYDDGDDDCDDYDPDCNHGFQNGVFDNIIF